MPPWFHSYLTDSKHEPSSAKLWLWLYGKKTAYSNQVCPCRFRACRQSILKYPDGKGDHNVETDLPETLIPPAV